MGSKVRESTKALTLAFVLLDFLALVLLYFLAFVLLDFLALVLLYFLAFVLLDFLRFVLLDFYCSMQRIPVARDRRDNKAVCAAIITSDCWCPHRTTL